MIADAQRGSLVTAYPVELLDCVYFSAVCFTTLGLGDIVPTGAVRLISGTEAVCGFVLIAWSGSFTFVEMQRFWKARAGVACAAGAGTGCAGSDWCGCTSHRVPL